MKSFFALFRKTWSVPHFLPVFPAIALLAAGLAYSMGVEAACSPYRDKVVINEVRVSTQSGTPSFLELKVLDPSVLSATNSFEGWKVVVYGGSFGNKGEATVKSVVTSSTKNTCGQTAIWLQIPDSDVGNKLTWNGNDPADVNIVLWDSGAGTKGQIVDIARVRSPATSYYGTTTYDACPEIEDALPASGTNNTRYDAVAGSGNSAKDYFRNPDGTGLWGGTANSAGSETICESNQGSGAGTFGLAKSPLSTLATTNSEFSYTLYAVNGATAVTNPASVIITDVLPTGTEFVSCTASPGTTSGVSAGPIGTCTHNGTGTVTWTVGAMAANKTYLVTLTVKATTGGSKTNSDTSNVGVNIPATYAAPVKIPAAEYRMDESSWSATAGAVAEAGNAYDGTAVNDGGLPTTSAGKICNAGNFDPGYVTVPYNAALNPANATFSFWVYPTSRPSAAPIIAKYSNSSYDYVAWIDSNGYLKFGWGSYFWLIPTPANTLTTSSTIPLNTWTHVVVTFDATNDRQRIYLNGNATPAASTAIAASMPSSANPLVIGYSAPSAWPSNFRFDGKIDEVKIFDAVLSTIEIATIYANENTGTKNFDGSTRTCPTSGHNHIRAYLDNNTSALTCSPRAISAIACNDASCTTRYTSDVSVTLNPGGTAATIPANGTGTPSVAQLTAGAAAVTLGASTPSASGSPTFRCFAGTVATPGTEIPGDCNITFSNAGLFVSVPHHRSCDTSILTITAAKTDDTTKKCVPAFDGGNNRDIKLRFGYTNPNSAASPAIVPTVGSASPPTTSLATGSDQTLPLAFTNGIATTNFRYQDAGSLTITARYSGSAETGDAGLSMDTILSNTSHINPFVVVPQGFVLSGIPTPPLVAGSPFNVTVTAKNNCSPSATTQNFAGTVVLTSSNPLPGTGNATAINQNLTVSSGGTVSANTTWNEVGTIDLTATATNYLSSGLNVTGSQTAVGRFQPAYFDTIVTPGCGTSPTWFTYAGLSGTSPLAGQPITKIEVKAKRFGGDSNDSTNTANYAGATWAKAVTLSDANAGSGTLTNGSLTAANFVSGKASRTDVAYAFSNKETAPYTLAIRAIDNDTPAVSSGGHAEGNTVMRSGRLRLSNAFGSEKTNLSIPIQLHYWSGQTWVSNNADTCTSLATGNFKLTGAKAGTSALSVVWISPGTGALTLSAPTPVAPPGTSTGSVAVCADLGPDPPITTPATGVVCAATTPAAMPWLQSKWPPGTAYNNDPSAKATFGIYSPETKKTIHVREAY